MASSSRPKKPVHNVHNGGRQLRKNDGEWGSRKLSFPDVVGLRPTPDRVRETLFNWLAPYIAGAKVLDPFAGSGALFLEALSRGAAQAQALDASNVAVSSLKEHLGTLRCTNWKPRPPANTTGCSSTRRSTRTCCRPCARCSKSANGWRRTRGSTPKARARRPAWACPEAGACTGNRNPGGCITRCGSARYSPRPKPVASELARAGLK